jgi:hypothetical protein
LLFGFLQDLLEQLDQEVEACCAEVDEAASESNLEQQLSTFQEVSVSFKRCASALPAACAHWAMLHHLTCRGLPAAILCTCTVG